MDISAARTIFKALDSNNNHRLDSDEVSPVGGCNPAAPDLIGVNSDAFVGVLRKKGVSDTLLQATAKDIKDGSYDPDHTVGARLGNFARGTGAALLNVLLAPLSIVITLLALLPMSAEDRKGNLKLAWIGFIGAGDLYSDAFAKSQPSDPFKVWSAKASFLEDPSIAGPNGMTCPN